MAKEVDRWRMDARGEVVRRGGRRLEPGGAAVRAGEGDVTDAGAAEASVPSEGRPPARCSHELQGHPLHISSIQQHLAQTCCSECGWKGVQTNVRRMGGDLWASSMSGEAVVGMRTPLLHWLLMWLS